MIAFPEPVSKARRRPALSAIEAEIRRLLRVAVAKVTASASARAIMDALDNGDVAQAIERVRFDLGEDYLLSTLPASLRDAYESAGVRVSAAASRELAGGYSFNLITPRAVEWTQATAGSLIRQWGESSRDAIRRLIARGFSEGLGSGAISRQIVQSGIGITWQSARGILNMRHRLELDGVPASEIDRSVIRRYNSLVRARAEMIARTEMTRAMTHARLESWRQGMERGLIDSSGYEKEWLTTNDSRACDECRDLDGARASVPDGVFIGENGTYGGLGPGAHPRCRCQILLVPKGSRKIPRAQPNLVA